MSQFKIDIKKFKHLKSDEHSTTLQHPAGHQITIAHAPLSKDMRAQLQAMAPPKAAEGQQTLKEQTKAPKMMADGGVPSSLSPDAPTPDSLSPAAPPIGNGLTDPGQPITSLYNYLGTPHEGDKHTSLMVPYNKLPAVGDESAKNEYESPSEAAGVQPSASETTEQAAANPLTQPLDPIADAIKTQEAANGYLEKAAKAEGAALQQAAEEQKISLAAQHKYDQNVLDTLDNHVQEVVNSISSPDSDIKPNHYYESLSTPGKVASAIGLILGGIGGGLTHQGNPALAFLNAQIDRDIKAQEANLGKKSTLLGAFQHMYGNHIVASNMARAAMNGIYAANIEKAAAASMDPMAKARALQAMAPLKLASAQFAQQGKVAALAQGNSPTGLSQNDPTMFVQHLVPKEEQSKAIEEITKAKYTNQNKAKIMALFDKANNENTLLGRAAHAGSTPASFEQLKMSAFPLIHTDVGRVTPQEAEQFVDAYLPKPGDGPQKIKDKRAGLESYMASQQKGDINRAYGINLDNFAATSPKASSTLTPEQQATVQKAKQMNPGVPDDRIIKELKRNGHI